MQNEFKFKLTLFGAGRLVRSDGEERTPSLKKAMGILAFLAVANEEPVERATLQDLFWSEKPSKQGRESLKACLHHLRRCFDGAFENPILTNGGPVSLCLKDVESDIWGQEKVSPLYRPKFLEGIDFNEIGAEEWLRFIRTVSKPSKALSPLDADTPDILPQTSIKNDIEELLNEILSRLESLERGSRQDRSRFQSTLCADYDV